MNPRGINPLGFLTSNSKSLLGIYYYFAPDKRLLGDKFNLPERG
jgi:hypothetical protein